MKKIVTPIHIAALLALVAWVAVACGNMKKEFTSPDGGTTPPPVSQQLSRVATLAPEVAPGGYGALVAAVAGSLSTVIASIAAYHAKNAAGTATATLAAVSANPPGAPTAPTKPT